MMRSGVRAEPTASTERGGRRRNYGFWLLATLAVLDVVLVRAHLLTVGQAVISALVVKVVLGGNILGGANAYRRSRARGSTVAAALTDALSWILPRWTAVLTVLMCKICLDLPLALFRGKQRDPNTYTIHHDPSATMMWWFNVVITIVTLAAVEFALALAHTPAMWHLVDVAANAFQLWILLGLWAGMATKGHRLDRDGVLLRGAVFGHVWIPYSSIATVRTTPGSVPGFGSWSRFLINPSTAELILAAGPAINVTVKLHGAIPVDPYRHGTPRGPVDTVLLGVDDPERFVAAVRERLPSV